MYRNQCAWNEGEEIIVDEGPLSAYPAPRIWPSICHSNARYSSDCSTFTREVVLRHKRGPLEPRAASLWKDDATSLASTYRSLMQKPRHLGETLRANCAKGTGPTLSTGRVLKTGEIMVEGDTSPARAMSFWDTTSFQSPAMGDD